MHNFKRRIELLQAAIENQIAVQRTHDPFILFQPLSIIKDQYQVSYYPEGMYQRPEKSHAIGIVDACAVLKCWPGDLLCQISFGYCLEWLFAGHQWGELGEKYTKEQLDSFLKEDIEKHPELSYMLTTEEGRQMAEILARAPQSGVVRLCELRQALEGLNYK